jgi:hypothetical protein
MGKTAAKRRSPQQLAVKATGGGATSSNGVAFFVAHRVAFLAAADFMVAFANIRASA